MKRTTSDDHTTSARPAPTPAAIFPGDGEMAALCRAFDWSTTPLGPVAGWSQSLRTTVGIVLGSRNPMFIWWGPELIQLYNDAYRPSFGAEGRHPRALGMRGEQCWTDIWSTIGPQIADVRATGEGTWHEDQLIPIERNGRLEDVWWTYSYGPVFDDDGTIGGVLVVCQETTRRMLSERDRERLVALTARAERRATSVIEQVSDEHLTLDSEFRIVAVNAAAERSIGVTRDTLLGRTHWEAFPASAGSEAERQYRYVVAERREAHFTHHYLGEGYDRHLEIDAYPTDEGGIAIFWRNVSDRVLSLRAVRDSEARYRALFDSLDEGFCVLELLFDAEDRPVDYRFLEANPAFMLQSGLSDARGRTARELIPGLESHWFETYGRVARTGEPIRFESSSDAMGRRFDLYAFRVGLPEEHKVAVLFKDVTASHAAERERERLATALEVERSRLAYVFERAPFFLAVLRGPAHVFELANNAYYELVGHRELIGRGAFDALPEMLEQGFQAQLDSVLSTGDPFVGRTVPVRVARTPGAPLEERFVDFTFLPLIEADGQRAGVIVHGSDVTEHELARREIERLLVESERSRSEGEALRAEAEAANRTKSEFLAVMSHELRTPLNAIGGYAELMEMGIRGPVTPMQREDLQRIQTSQRHLLGLINEVLNYAKLETGSVEYKLVDVPVREAMTAAESLVAPQARARGLALTIAACAVPLIARADAEKLRQILVNLLSNAVKFTERGGRIEMSCGFEDSRVAIHVRDTGIGIPADKLEVVFDPFVQVRADLTRPYEGTGLGLAISRDLARGMGGELTAESSFGVGSTFTLVLPGTAS